METSYDSTCGVTLSRNDYYTLPPLNELRNYKNANGECIVTGFVVGHISYGSVCFPDPVDVSNLNLDQIVSFRLGEVTLYDDEAEPSIGEGLNRRARVEMKRLWPRNDSEAKFEARLRFLSDQQKATFIDYCPVTGTCTFGVEHFSKYSYRDSDGDCEMVADDADNEMQQMEENLKWLKELDDVRAKRGLGGVPLQDSASTSMVSHPARPVDVSRYPSVPKPLYLVKSSFFDEESISDDVSSCDVGAHLSIQNSSTCTSTVSDKMNVYPSHGLIKRYTLLSRVREPVSHEIDQSFDRYGVLADMTLCKGRSFKVGWGPGMKLITLSPKSRGASLMGEPNCVDIVDVAADVFGNRATMDLEGHLNIALNSCTFTASQSSLPSCTVQDGWETLVQHQMIAKQLTEASQHNNLVRYYSHTWELCLALWGPDAVSSSARRELFSSWLQTLVRSDGVDVGSFSNDSEMVLRRIFVHLLSHQVYEASQLAMNHDLPSLGILIAQTQQSTRHHLSTQIAQWQDRGSMTFISAHIKKVYALLAGLPIIADVNILDGLKWKRILALYLWYICPPGVLLDEAVKEYTNAFESINIANYPTVEHNTAALVYDTQYQILQLNHNPQHLLNKALNPAGHTENICDYRFSWLLMQVLTSLKIGSLPASIRDATHIQFATQLEAMGMWKWAAFVILFVKEPRLKRHQLTSILERNLQMDDNTEIIKFLVRKLQISPAIIHEVLAQKTESAGEFIVSFRHYLLGNNWWRAHSVCVAHVIPDLILREEFDLLLEFLSELFADKSPQLASAGLIYEFLELCRRIEMGPSAENRRLVPEIFSIINRLKQYPATEPRQFLAKLEVARHLKRMLNLAHYDTDEFTAEPDYEELGLPFDYEYTMSMWKS